MSQPAKCVFGLPRQGGKKGNEEKKHKSLNFIMEIDVLMEQQWICLHNMILPSLPPPP